MGLSRRLQSAQAGDGDCVGLSGRLLRAQQLAQSRRRCWLEQETAEQLAQEERRTISRMMIAFKSSQAGLARQSIGDELLKLNCN